MSSKHKNLSVYQSETIPDGHEFKIGIVVSEWNNNVTDSLLEGSLNTLKKHGVEDENIVIVHVPGTYELTSGASVLIRNKKLDGVICLGCVVKGETRHDEYINSAVAHGLTNLSLAMNKPVIFGVLTVENMYQAVDRAGGKHGNKGIESAVTVLRMIELFKKMQEPTSKIGF